MINAVKKGEISEERVNASVSRILKLKKDSGLYAFQSTNKQDLKKTLQLTEHTNLAREIAYRSVDIKQWVFNFDISKSNIAILAPKILQAKIKNSNLLKLGKHANLFVFKNLEPSLSERHHLLEAVKDYDHVIFVSYNSWKTPKQMDLLNEITLLKPTVCIASRDPYDLNAHDHSVVKIATYSPTACSLQVVADYLGGKTDPLIVFDKKDQKTGARIWFNKCHN